MPPRNPAFWDGAAWALRMVLVLAHLLFGVIAIVRPNIPLLFKGYSAFDDSLPFAWWGLWNLAAALVLWLVPTRVPFGLISTILSAFLLFFIGAMFGTGGGLLFGTAIFYAFGVAAGVLFMRSLWLYMVKVRWFQRYVLRGPHA